MLDSSNGRVGRAIQQSRFARPTRASRVPTVVRMSSRSLRRSQPDISETLAPSHPPVLAARWQLASDGQLELRWLLTA
jgi:hypothetical protein